MENFSRRLRFLHTLAWFILTCHDDKRINILPVYASSFIRDAEMQKKLHDQGLTPCDGTIRRSRHQDGEAIDMLIFNSTGDARLPLTDAAYAEAGALWEELGGRWGGRFSPPEVWHFQAARDWT